MSIFRLSCQQSQLSWQSTPPVVEVGRGFLLWKKKKHFFYRSNLLFSVSMFSAFFEALLNWTLAKKPYSNNCIITTVTDSSTGGKLTENFVTSHCGSSHINFSFHRHYWSEANITDIQNNQEKTAALKLHLKRKNIKIKDKLVYATNRDDIILIKGTNWPGLPFWLLF